MNNSKLTSCSSAPNLNKSFRSNICINFLIDIVQDRVNRFHIEGDLFSERDNKLFIGHVKLLAVLQKMQEIDKRAKANLESSIYEDILEIINGKR